MAIPLEPSRPTGATPQMKDYACANPCTWCEGCGDYGVWTAVKRALVDLGLHPWQVLLCYDVGCHGNMSDKLHGYRFHGLHGRVIPFASGAKLANPEVPVLVFAGDGATFSEGVGHLVHAIRSNYPITFILHNNCDYALTTGQASALTWQNQPMNSSPNGIPERTLNAMDFVFSLEPAFVARGFSGDIPQLTQILKAAIEHQRFGFAYVEVLQVCTTYNSFMTQEYLLERCFKVENEGHDPANVDAARRIATNGAAGKIATGILYQRRDVPTFYERLAPRQGRETTPVQEVRRVDVSEYLKEFV